MPKFRWWMHNLWIDNCEEKNLYNDGPKYTVQQYWQKYRSWLLQEYRKQRKIEKEQNERRKQFEQWAR